MKSSTVNGGLLGGGIGCYGIVLINLFNAHNAFSSDLERTVSSILLALIGLFVGTTLFLIGIYLDAKNPD